MAKLSKSNSKTVAYAAGQHKPAALSHFDNSKVGTPLCGCAQAGKPPSARKTLKVLPAANTHGTTKTSKALPNTASSAKAVRPIPCDLVSISLSDGTMMLVDAPCTSPAPGLLGSFDNFLVQVASSVNGGDIVMERLLDRAGPAPTPPKSLSLTFASKYVGSCPNKQHPRIMFTPKRAGDPLKAQIWHTATPPAIKFEGEPEPPMLQTSSWLAPYWIFSGNSAHEYTIVAESCGCRADGSPITQLSALVRIYPNDTYKLTLRIPPAATFSASGSHQEGFDGSTTELSSISGRILDDKRGHSDEQSTTQKSDTIKASTKHTNTSTKGTYSQSESATLDSKGITYAHQHSLSTEKSSYSKTDSATLGPDGYSQTETVKTAKTTGVKGLYHFTKTEIATTTDTVSEDGEMVTGSLKFHGSFELVPEFSLTKNGHELGLTKLINEILNLYTTIHEALEAIKNFRPTVGWNVSFEVAVFEGSITGTWGNRQSRNSTARFSMVEPYYIFDFAIKLFAFTLTLTLGLDAHLSAFGIDIRADLKVEGTLGVEVSVHDHLEISDGKNSMPVDGKGTGSLNAECCVSVGEFEIKPFQAQVTGGFGFEGELLISASKHPHVEGTLKRLSTKGKAVVFHVGWKQTESPEFEILEEKELWKGVLPASN